MRSCTGARWRRAALTVHALLLALACPCVGIVVLSPQPSQRFAHVSAAFGPGAPKAGEPTVVLDLIKLSGRGETANTGCATFSQQLPKQSVRGKAVLLMRGACDFYKKAENAQAAGAGAVVVYNQPNGENAGRPAELITMTHADNADPAGITIPAIFVAAKTGALLLPLADGRTQVAINATGEVAEPGGVGRAELARSLPGMLSMASPFRGHEIQQRMNELSGGDGYGGGHVDQFRLPGAVTVALDRTLPQYTWPKGATADQQQGLVLDARGGLFRPGDDCSSLHGPRCQAVKHFFRANHAMQVFASQTKASSRVNIMDRISDLPIIKAIAETQLKLLLGEPLYKRVKATGQLSQQGTRYQVPQTVLPRYEVKGASVPGVDGSYVAAQLTHYNGPAPYTQEEVSMHVFSKVPRNIPAKTGRVIVYRYQPEDYDAAPVAAASIFPPLGKWIPLYEAKAQRGDNEELLPPETGWRVAAGAVAALAGSGVAAGGGPPTLRRKEPLLPASAIADAVSGKLHKKMASGDYTVHKADPATVQHLGSHTHPGKMHNVTLFSGPNCSGAYTSLTLDTRELRCVSCFDVCGKRFQTSDPASVANAESRDNDNGMPPRTHDESSKPHSKIGSLALYSREIKVSSHVNCHGTWKYGDKMRQHHKWHVYEPNDPAGKGRNCVAFTTDDRFRPSHFVLHRAAPSAP